MKERLEKLERDLLITYNKIRKEIPALKYLSFDITTYRDGGTGLGGFYFVSSACESFGNIQELDALITKVKVRREKNEVLYRRFTLKEN